MQCLHYGIENGEIGILFNLVRLIEWVAPCLNERVAYMKPRVTLDIILLQSMK